MSTGAGSSVDVYFHFIVFALTVTHWIILSSYSNDCRVGADKIYHNAFTFYTELVYCLPQQAFAPEANGGNK